MLERSLNLQKLGFLCWRGHWPYRNLDFYASDLGQKVYKSCGWTESSSCSATVQGVTPLVSIQESHNMYILHVHCTLYIVHCTLYNVHCTCFWQKPFFIHISQLCIVDYLYPNVLLHRDSETEWFQWHCSKSSTRFPFYSPIKYKRHWSTEAPIAKVSPVGIKERICKLKVKDKKCIFKLDWNLFEAT